MMDAVPWLVDRRSRESKWNVCHRNGRSEGTEKVPLPFNNLYAAGYVLSWADSLWYYPPLQVYGHPFNMADLQGKGFDSHDMVSGLISLKRMVENLAIHSSLDHVSVCMSLV